jgi:hypothetical protein
MHGDLRGAASIAAYQSFRPLARVADGLHRTGSILIGPKVFALLRRFSVGLGGVPDGRAVWRLVRSLHDRGFRCNDPEVLVRSARTWGSCRPHPRASGERSGNASRRSMAKAKILPRPKTLRTSRARHLDPSSAKDRKAPANVPLAQAPFADAIAAVADLFTKLGKPYCIIGGMAVVSHGYLRTTRDIDVACCTDPSSAAALIRLGKKYGFRPRVPNAEGFAAHNLVLLLEHTASGVPLDVSFAMQAFERTAAENAKPRSLFGTKVPIVGRSDLVVYKMIASRRQDLADVEALLARSIDVRRITNILSEFDAILETDRARDFGRLYASVRR